MPVDIKSICFVIPNFVTFSTGGAEIQVYYLIQAFLKRGWKVEVVCAGLGHEKEISQSPFVNQEVRYHYYRKRNIRVLEFWDVLRVLKNTHSKFYYQRTDFALTASVFYYTKQTGSRMIFALAGDSDAERKKYSTYFKQFHYTNMFKKWIRKADFLILDKMLEWTKKRVTKVVCQNQTQLQLYTRHFNSHGIVIPNSFSLLKEVKEVKENVVLWVGNNSPVKQPGLFVELAKYFENYRDWHFVMLGSACDALLLEDIPHNLSVLGSLSYHEANKWFARAKVYVNTSASEGMPNNFIQSWFFETLILSLNVDPDHVFSELNVGFCFHGELERMQQYILRVMEGEDISQPLKHGNVYFNQQFNVDKNVDTLIKYIES